MPGKVSGAWVVKGTRVPVQAVVDNAEDGYTPEEIAWEIFEGLPLDRVQSVIPQCRCNCRSRHDQFLHPRFTGMRLTSVKSLR